MKKEYSYSSLLSKEKEFTISLSKIRKEKNEMIKDYKRLLSNEEKFLFILIGLEKASYDEFLDNLMYLDCNLNIQRANEFIKSTSQVLLKKSKIGLIKSKSKYGFYILKQ